MGNLRSVLNALERLEAKAELVDSAERVEGHEKLVLPGVGAFGDGMANLRERGFADALPQLVVDGTPLLGICLGMQLLASCGTEHGDHEGLGLIAGSVERLNPGDGLRVPHVGWNSVEALKDSSLLKGAAEEPTFYFVHSYEFRADDPESISGTTPYGRPVNACVEVDNVYGVQFHPEKSQRDGLALLKNFIEL